MSGNNYLYDYLLLTEFTNKHNKYKLIYKLDKDTKVVSDISSKFIDSMEIIKFKTYDLVDSNLSKLYILCHELKQNDDDKFHFVCNTSIDNGGNIIIEPLNKYNLSYQKTSLAMSKLTFSFYKFDYKKNNLEQIDISHINVLPLEIIFKYHN